MQVEWPSLDASVHGPGWEEPAWTLLQGCITVTVTGSF